MTTCGGREEAERIAAGLVEDGLAACVQLAGIRSVYRWEGKVSTDDEVALYIKARRDRYPEIEAYIKSQHSYDLPEIIAVPIEAGSPEYLAWIDETAS